MSEENPEKHIRLLYHRLGSQDLRDLLDDMLFDLKFTSPCVTEGDMALNNYAKILLAKVYADEENIKIGKEQVGVLDSSCWFDAIRRVLGRKK